MYRHRPGLSSAIPLSCKLLFSCSLLVLCNRLLFPLCRYIRSLANFCNHNTFSSALAFRHQQLFSLQQGWEQVSFVCVHFALVPVLWGGVKAGDGWEGDSELKLLKGRLVSPLGPRWASFCLVYQKSSTFPALHAQTKK